MSVLRLEAKPKAFQRLQAVPSVGRRPSVVVAGTMIGGIVAILLAGLFLWVATSEGVYEIANLKNQKKNLTESVSILSSQVDSLSSAQNLSGAAQKLGMVANSNPVFLNVEAKKLYGKPMAAIKSSQGRITKNLVPNAQLTTKTNISELKGTTDTVAAETVVKAPVKQASGKNANVATEQAPFKQVISNSGKLPGSPTN